MGIPDDDPGEARHVPLPAIRAIVGLIWLGGALSAVLILAALGLTIYAIVQRYVLHTPLLWADELMGYAVVAIVMTGAAEAYRRGDHISINLAAARTHGRLACGLAVWSDLAVLAFAAVLGWSTWDSITFAIAFGSYSAGEIEVATWIPQIPILVGSVLFSLAAIVRILARLGGERMP